MAIEHADPSQPSPYLALTLSQEGRHIQHLSNAFGAVGDQRVRGPRLRGGD